MIFGAPIYAENNVAATPRLDVRPGQVIIAGVKPQGPAEGAGIRAVDVLLAVDGTAVDGLDFAGIAAWVSGWPTRSSR